MDDKRLEEIFKEAKCNDQAACDHNCSNCSISKTEPGMWKVYLGLAVAVILIALAAKYISAFIGSF